MHISTFIPGKPVPKQSFHISSRGHYVDERVSAWQDTVAVHVKQRIVGKPPEDKNFSVVLQFFLPDKRKRDLDNLSKSVLDALTGIVWVDDTQVVNLHLSKIVRPKKPGVHIMAW